MTPPEPAMAPERAPMPDRADELSAEFRGDARAAIAALLEDRDALLDRMMMERAPKPP